MVVDKDTLKSWFQRGMKPLATQFASWIDSFWHKGDIIPTASIDGLENTLNKKAEQLDVNNLYAEFIIHRADDERHKTEAEQGKLNNLAANPNATYATKQELGKLSEIIVIPADFTKGTSEMETEIIQVVKEHLEDDSLFQKPVFLLYKWKKDYTGEDAPVSYAIVSKSDEKRTEGSAYTNIQMFFNSSIIVTEADAPEYPAAYCIVISIRGEQVRIHYQQYENQHPVYGIYLTEDGNGIINSLDKNWDKLYTELTKDNHPLVALKTPDSGMYCPASYEFTPLDASLASPIYTGKMEISYLKEQEDRQELWVETRVFSDLTAATGTYNADNYLKKFALTGNGELVDIDTKDCIVTFPDQDTRTNIASGEKHSVLFGKIKRWFTDLKAVAFTGRAADLTQDADNRLVTDAEKAGWADKYTRTEVDSKDAAVLQQAKEYAAQKIAEIVGSAPETLDTLNELAAALGNDPNFATSIMALIGGKADLVHTHTKAQITDFPASLPANGGNADTVGGFSLDNLGKIINSAIADIDNTPGFFSGFWNTATAGTKPGSYGTVLQVANKYGLPNSGKEVWVFQIAHVHGIDRPYWRRQYNNGGWSSWKQVALMDDIPNVYEWAKAANKPTYNMSEITNAAQALVAGGQVMRKTIVCNVKPEGFLSRLAVGLSNPTGQFSPGILSICTNDQGTEWLDWTFGTNGRIYDPAGKQFAYLEETIAPNNESNVNPDSLVGKAIFGFGYSNNGWPTTGPFISLGGSTNDYPLQISADYKGAKIYWRTFDGDLKSWNSWQRIAMQDNVLGNVGEQTLFGGRLNMLVSAPEHVLMFNDAAGNIGYIGFGAYPTKDLQIMNYATGKYINIAADGKLYYDQKELAFKGDTGGSSATLMLDTRGTPEAIQRNKAVYAALYGELSTLTEEIPRIGLLGPAEMGYSTGQRLWAIGAAQSEGGIKLTFCGLDSNDVIQYVKAMVNNAGVLVTTLVPH